MSLLSKKNYVPRMMAAAPRAKILTIINSQKQFEAYRETGMFFFRKISDSVSYGFSFVEDMGLVVPAEYLVQSGSGGGYVANVLDDAMTLKIETREDVAEQIRRHKKFDPEFILGTGEYMTVLVETKAVIDYINWHATRTNGSAVPRGQIRLQAGHINTGNLLMLEDVRNIHVRVAWTVTATRISNVSAVKTSADIIDAFSFTNLA